MSNLFFLAAFAASASLGYASQSLRFEPNRGQADPQVRFMARGQGYSIFLTAGGAILAPHGGDSKTPALRISLRGAASRSIQALNPLPGVSNYLRGPDPRRWIHEVPAFARVRYSEVYPGVDWVFRGEHGQLEFDFLVAPGAAPGAISFALDGARSQRIDPSGDVVLALGSGEVRLHRPQVYQPGGAPGRPVSGGFVRAGKNRYRFAIGPFDSSKPLVIDPAVNYATFLGGSADDFARSIAVDSFGNAFVTGITESANFPVKNGAQSSHHAGSMDAFVTKLSKDGSTLVYSTYLGGSADDYGNAVAVTAQGYAYVAGFTKSVDFPVLNAFQPNARGSGDAFVAALDPSGRLVWSTYLGSSEKDEALGIALDSYGSPYVTGYTYASFDPFPTTPGAVAAGGSGSFVTKFAPSGPSVAYSTLLGNSAIMMRAIALDSAGNAYTAGSYYGCQGSAGALPGRGGYDAVVTKLNSSGSAKLYTACVGGSDSDFGNTIAVDASGSAFIAGGTFSSDFPAVTPIQAHLAAPNQEDAFVAKLNPAGSALVFSTYLGSHERDSAYGIAVDSAGASYVAGTAYANDFPFAGPPLGRGAGFLAKLAPSGSSLVYSTPLAITAEYGLDGHEFEGLALDAAGAVYIAGSAGFLQTTPGAFQPRAASELGDAGIVKIDEAKPAITSFANAASFLTGPVAAGEIVSLFGAGLGPAAGVSAAPNAQGFFPTTLAGTEVRFDGLSAPIIFTRSDVVNAVVPYALAGKTSSQVQIDYQGVTSAAYAVSVNPSAPGIFTLDGSGHGPAAIFNEDWSLNSPSNPAAQGSIVFFYATGGGQTSPPGVDGRVTDLPLPTPLLPVSVDIGDSAAELIYGGAAYGYISGLMQINVRIPAVEPSGPSVPIIVRIGQSSSQPGVTLAVR